MSTLRLTETLEKQYETRESVCNELSLNKVYNRKIHVKYLLRKREILSSSYQSLDSSQPWLVFWQVNSMRLLDEQDHDKDAMIAKLESCRSKITGGYGGGPGQMAHLATTYAAVMALTVLGVKVPHKEQLVSFVMGRMGTDGSFTMHHMGETDVRGVYCAVSVLSVTGELSKHNFVKTVEWIKSCQSYEGGYGSRPRDEAHAGYTFCAVVSLRILTDDWIEDPSLLHWISKRQCSDELGFNGRTNKLVDVCYSYWAGALSKVYNILGVEELNRYILACQDLNGGGFMDKPGKGCDLYHTNYGLCGFFIDDIDVRYGLMSE